MVESTQTIDRNSQKEELKQRALQMMADAKELKEGWSVAHDDASKDYKIWVRKTADGPQVVTEIRADGVTPEKMQQYGSNWQAYASEMDKNLTIGALPDDNGAKIYHINYKMSGLMGFMVSDRTFYMAYWEEEDSKGFTTIDTTEGNKHIEEANKKTTGKNVLGTIHVEYFRVSFDEGGACRMTKVSHAHAGGSLPRGTGLPTSAIVGDARKEMEGLIDFVANKMK